MNALNIIHSAGHHLKPLALALTVAAGLGAGSAQALTTTQTFDLGTSPAGTAFATGGANSLFVWIAKGSLPAGSILRSVTATNIKLEANSGDNYTGDIGVVVDPSPESPGGADNLLTINDENGAGAFGGSVHTDWAGQGFTYNPFSATVSAPVNFPATIDLHDGAVMLGSAYGAGTYSGTITLEYDVVASATFVTFGPNAAVGELVGNAAAIAWTVPYGSDVTALAPTFTLSSGTCDKVSGGTYNFTNPVVYTVTDGPTVNTYTVTVTVAPDETTLLWNVGSGAWDFSTPNWKGLVSGVSTPFFNGKNVIFDQPTGGTVTLVSGIQPQSTTVNSSGNYAFSGLPLGGTGSLTKAGDGRLTISGQQDNTYSGGTIINAGKLYLFDVQTFAGLGTGPVTLNGGVLHLDRFALSNSLTVNGGSIIMDNGFGSSITGPITSNVQLEILSKYTNTQKLEGTISGPGGITLTSENDGGLDVTGTNTYTGDTIVNGGILKVHGSSIKDSNKLVINGGKVQPIGAETVASLFFGATQQATGTWGATDSGADHIDDGHFSGTAGVVNVSAGTPYTIWADGTFANGTLSDKDPASDPDHDGRTNQQEFAFGLDPTAGASANPISQQLDKTTGVFKYTRTKDSGLTYTYQSSVTLSDPWDVFTPVSAVSNNATPVEEITVTVPSLLLSESKLFLRVQAQ